MEIKKENWFFCVLCDTVSYKFDCCGNIACSGGGCDKCKELNPEIWKIVNEGKAPNKDEVPHYNDTLEDLIEE